MEAPFVSPLGFGFSSGSGNGKANAMALLQAVDHVVSVGGGNVKIPGGNYEVAGAIVIDSCPSPVKVAGNCDITPAETGGAETERAEEAGR